jgi:hypothetical protein
VDHPQTAQCFDEAQFEWIELAELLLALEQIPELSGPLIPATGKKQP